MSLLGKGSHGAEKKQTRGQVEWHLNGRHFPLPLFHVPFLQLVMTVMFAWHHKAREPQGRTFPSLFFLPSLFPFPYLSGPRFPWTCLSLLLCAVGSFSEHLDQINGRSECVDSTDNSAKPSSEPASHMARQRLESTEKKKISGKVTKSLSASALSLMIPGGRETSTRMKLCDVRMWPSFPGLGMLMGMQDG